MALRVVRKALSGIAGRHWIILLAAATCFSIGLTVVALPLKLNRLGWSDLELGLVAAVGAACYALSCFVYSLVVSWAPLRLVMSAALVFSAAAGLGLAVVDAGWALFLLAPAYWLGTSFFWPSLMAWIGESDEEHLVGDMAAFNCAWMASATAGCLVAGAMDAWAAGSALFLMAGLHGATALVIPLARIRGRLASMGTPVSPPTRVILPRRFLVAGWLAAFVTAMAMDVPGAIFVKLNSQLGFGSGDFGTFLAVRGAAQTFVALALGVFQGWRYRRLPMVGCLALAAGGSALLAGAGGRGGFFAAFLLLGAGSGVGYTVGFYYSVHGRRNPKRNAGLFEAMIVSQNIFGAPLGGLVATVFGRRSPYLVLAAIAAAAAVAQHRFLRGVGQWEEIQRALDSDEEAGFDTPARRP